MKNKPQFTLLFLSFLFYSFIDHAQIPSWQWASIGAGSGGDRGYCTTTDNYGNVFVAGQFSDSSISFGSTTLLNYGHEDIFIVKYDASGIVQWANSIGDTVIDVAYGIACDTSGNVFITGNFLSSTLVVGNDTLQSAGLNDLLLVKYDQNGSVVWAHSNGGNGMDYGNKIQSDNNGYLYLTGNFSSPSITFGTTTLFAIGTSKSFTVKYDYDGNTVWAIGTDYQSFDQSKCVTVDDVGNVYTAGIYYYSSVIIGTDTLANQGNSDIYLAKYNSSGSFLWAITAGGFREDEVTGVVADANGNVYLSGHFLSPFISFGTTAINNSAFTGWDLYVAKYNSNGNLIWVYSATDNIFEDVCTGVSLNNSGNICVSGWYQDSLTLGSTTLHSAGGTDMFVAGFDTSGAALWAKSAGGQDDDFTTAIAIHSDAIYVTGFFSSASCMFDTISINDPNTGFDMFLAKLNNTTSSVSESEINSDINLFPNPSNGHLHLTSSIKEKGVIKIYSEIGECIYNAMFKDHEEIDISKFSKGIYFCEMTFGSEITKRKIIVY